MNHWCVTLRKEKYLSIRHSDDVGVKVNRIKLLDNRDCMSHLALAEEGFFLLAKYSSICSI